MIKIIVRTYLIWFLPSRMILIIFAYIICHIIVK